MGQPSPQPIGLFEPAKLRAGMLVEIPYPGTVRTPPRTGLAPVRGVITDVEVPPLRSIIVTLKPLSDEQAKRYGFSNFEPQILCSPHRTVRVLEIEP